MSDDLNAGLEITETPIQDISGMPTDEGIEAQVKIAYPALQDYFHIEGMTDGQREKMSIIWQYFSPESKSIGDLMYKMRQLENRLGSPAIGETRLQKVYNYVKISAQIKDKELQRDSLLRK